MRKLIEYRQQKALHHELMKAADFSMLDADAIVMLYHCAKVSVGDILGVGAYIGGAMIAMARGVRGSVRVWILRSSSLRDPLLIQLVWFE